MHFLLNLEEENENGGINMKIRDILTEYDRSKTAQQMGGTIATAAEREPQLRELEPEQQVDAVLQKAEAADPTPNKKYVLWIVRQFVKNDLKYEDINEFLQQDIQQFHELPKQRKQQLDIETDINKYKWQDLRKIADKLKNVDVDSESDAKLDYKHIDDMKVLYVGDMGQLIIPETEAASCEIGSGTRWCTAGTQSDNMFDHYSKDGPLYVWIPAKKMPEKKSSNKYQFHFPSAQFMDENDEEINSELIDYFRTKHPVLKKLFVKGEKVIAQDPNAAYRYARQVIRGRWPEAEEAIAQYPDTAFDYAKDVIKGRWPEVEELISQDARTAYQYARDVIGGRWPEGEEEIAQNSKSAHLYARYVIGGRWPEGEKAIAQEPDIAYQYARDVIKGRFPDGESLIAQDPRKAYQYAKDVIGGRFPEGEEEIAQDARTAFPYARDIIKGRFPEGEEIIAQDHAKAVFYALGITGKRFPEGEKVIKYSGFKDNYEQEFGVDLDKEAGKK